MSQGLGKARVILGGREDRGEGKLVMTLGLAEGLVGWERERKLSRTVLKGPQPDKSSARGWEEGRLGR